MTKQIAKAKRQPAKIVAFVGRVDAGLAPGSKHIPGSRKGHVHMLWESKGRDAALAWGEAQGLAPASLKSWMATWTRKTAALANQRKASRKAKAKNAAKRSVKQDPAKPAVAA